MEQRLRSTQPTNVTAIPKEIKQLCIEMRAASSTLLVIPMPNTTIEAFFNLFAEELQLCVFGKGPRLRDDDSNAMI